MKTSIKNIAISLVVAVAVALTPASVGAFSGTIQDGANSAKGTSQATDLFGASGVFSTITNILLFVLGAVSVIMIIIGGLRYVVSGGDSTSVTAAKNTILYAIVGIVIALLAYAIVNFILGTFTGSNGGGTNV